MRAAAMWLPLPALRVMRSYVTLLPMFVGRLCQTPIRQPQNDGVSQKRPTISKR